MTEEKKRDWEGVITIRRSLQKTERIDRVYVMLIFLFVFETCLVAKGLQHIITEFVLCLFFISSVPVIYRDSFSGSDDLYMYWVICGAILMCFVLLDVGKEAEWIFRLGFSLITIMVSLVVVSLTSGRREVDGQILQELRNIVDILEEKL